MTTGCTAIAGSLALPAGVRLRSATDADLSFLERVYASTRAEELAPTGWSETEKSAFLGFQFRAQHQHYTANYHGAEFLVIEVDRAAVGRLYLHRRPGDLRVVDIALLPHARRMGLGTALLRELQAFAAAEQRCLSIHVEQMNPAMRLYQRLGFVKAGEHGIYHLMEWRG